MQLDVEVDMDTPRHLSAVLAETILDKGRVHTYAQEEGTSGRTMPLKPTRRGRAERAGIVRREGFPGRILG